MLCALRLRGYNYSFEADVESAECGLRRGKSVYTHALVFSLLATNYAAVYSSFVLRFMWQFVRYAEIVHRFYSLAARPRTCLPWHVGREPKLLSGFNELLLGHYALQVYHCYVGYSSREATYSSFHLRRSLGEPTGKVG